jgi:hypothetical protein
MVLLKEPPRPPWPPPPWVTRLSCRRCRCHGCHKLSSLAIGGGGAAHQGEAQLTREEAQLSLVRHRSRGRVGRGRQTSRVWE